MKTIILILLLSVVCFGQYRVETVSFVDTTTSALIDVPGRDLYLAGIAKPDSGGLEISFEVEINADSTNQYVLLTALADSAYTITLPDSTSAYTISLQKDVFDPWRYFRIVFDKAMSVDLTVIWRRK